jgi:hypothetical protein
MVMMFTFVPITAAQCPVTKSHSTFRTRGIAGPVATNRIFVVENSSLEPVYSHLQSETCCRGESRESLHKS